MTGDIGDALTEPQRECLRLVLTHHSSKEIAALLGISPSAVDKRIERAIQVVGATSRFDAARRLARHEGGPTYEPLPCEQIDLPTAPPKPHPIPQVEPWWLFRRLAGLAPSDGSNGTVRNPLSGKQRALLILGLVLTISMASLALVSIASTLTTLIGPLRGGASHARAPVAARSGDYANAEGTPPGR